MRGLAGRYYQPKALKTGRASVYRLLNSRMPRREQLVIEVITNTAR
jgi:hypothetical protein